MSRRFRAEVLQEADVICTTLAGSGHEILEPFDFEMVIIDEAAQAIELSSLIPLKYRCNRCVMVGGEIEASSPYAILIYESRSSAATTYGHIARGRKNAYSCPVSLISPSHRLASMDITSLFLYVFRSIDQMQSICSGVSLFSNTSDANAESLIASSIVCTQKSVFFLAACSIKAAYKMVPIWLPKTRDHGMCLQNLDHITSIT